MSESPSAGARFRAALAAESPLQVAGAITAYAGLMARRVGYKALYLSGGGVAANSLGMPDLGITLFPYTTALPIYRKSVV